MRVLKDTSRAAGCTDPFAAGAHDCFGRILRLHSDGDRHKCRRGGSTPASDGGDRRVGDLDNADSARAARDLRLVCQATRLAYSRSCTVKTPMLVVSSANQCGLNS